ncbi:hypothetical protein NHF40_02135 [Maricaulaceae bacterium EIL42A08]|nr:hypothetical protein [Maricaulaceae bacterium EIL42A08]
MPVISLKVGSCAPAGFIRNKQAIQGNSKRISADADQIFEVLNKRLAGAHILREAALTTFSDAPSFDAAKRRFARVKELGNLSEEEVRRLVNAYNSNSQISGCWALSGDTFVDYLNKNSSVKCERGRNKIRIKKESDEEDFPF